MIITKETKERFVKMLEARQIIVIQFDKSRSRETYDYKFIGASSDGKWDFTPLCAELSGHPNNSSTHVQKLVIRALDAAEVICDTLEGLRDENIIFSELTGHRLYEAVREKISTFYA